MSAPEPHRPQSMSDAVEVAARAIQPFQRWSGMTDAQLKDTARAALSAIGLPELLSEVERLRGVDPNAMCEPCSRDDHDACTGDCLSLCCALASSEAENERLHRNIGACLEHLDLIQASLAGGATYTCALCGAGPDDDHTESCPLEASRRRLNLLASEDKT